MSVATLRPFRPDDVAALLALLRTLTPIYFAPEEATPYAHYLLHEVEDYFVAEQQGQVVAAGGLNYFLAERIARLSWDLVHPACQRQGLGRALVQHRLGWLRAHQPGVARVVVRTSQLAYRFYARQGFWLEETVPDYWAPGFDLYRLARKL